MYDSFESWLYVVRKGNTRGKGKTLRRKTTRDMIEVYRPRHPMARKSGYILEHHIVWEQHNTACLLPWAIVFHKNGKKDDNRISNLGVITRGSIGTRHYTSLRVELPKILKKMGL